MTTASPRGLAVVARRLTPTAGLRDFLAMSTLHAALDLTGRRALVTGATKGIGRAIAGELAALGARVIVVARDAAAVHEVASVIGGEGVVADVADPAGRAAILAAAGARPLHILVNNVGTNVRKPTAEFTLEDLRRIMAVNVESAFELTRAVRPALAAAAEADGDASVVHLSSIASRTIIGTSSCAYTMSKAALDAMSDWLAVEWGPLRIRSNVVHPWYINTPLVAEVLEDADRRAAIEDATPLRRVGEPEEVARAVAFLASPAGSYLSGAHLDVDGAFSRSGLPSPGPRRD